MAVDPTTQDPNDPAAIIRQRALAQAGGVSDPAAPVPSPAPSTPSPTFTTNTPPVTAPTAGTAPGPTSTSGTGAVGAPGTFPTTPASVAAQTTQNAIPPGTPGTFAPNSPNDPNPSDPYMQLQAFLQGHAGDPQAGINAWMGASGKSTPGAQWYPDTQTIGLANGTYLVAPGAGGNPSKTNWQVVQRGAETAPGAGSVNGAALPQQPNPFLDQIRAMLTQRLATDSQPVDPNDANIAQPLSAASDQASRQTDQERKALAERLYASGGGDVDQAQLSQGIQQSAEKNALGLGSLKAQLITQALTAKRQDLSDAMQLAIASGDSDSARNISLQIAALNAELTREGIGANLAISTTNANTGTSNAAAGR